MIHISSDNLAIHPVALDDYLRVELDTALIGLGTGPYGCIAHLDAEAGQDEQDTAQAIIENEGALTVHTTKDTITVGVADDGVVTCDELPDDFDYVIYRDGEKESAGSVDDGMMELTAQSAGSYMIQIREQGGDYRSGYVQIEAVEA